MKAIILAAGQSSRLGDLTRNKPKCCLSLTEDSLIIDKALESLYQNSFTDLIFVTGHCHEIIEETISKNWNGKFRQTKFIYNPEYKNKNNSYTSYLIRDLLGDDSFVFNSDIIYDEKILKLAIEYHQKSNSSFLVIDDTKPCDEEDMKVLVKRGRIIEINKSIEPQKALGEYIGIMHINSKDSQIFKTKLENFTQWDKYYEDVLDLSLEEINLAYVSTEANKWTEIDTIEDYNYAKELFCVA